MACNGKDCEICVGFKQTPNDFSSMFSGCTRDEIGLRYCAEYFQKLEKLARLCLWHGGQRHRSSNIYMAMSVHIEYVSSIGLTDGW